MNAVTQFGSNLDLLWDGDPRMLAIRMARYKFVAKMLAGMDRVLEVGAGDGRLSRIVRQTVGELILCDKEPQGQDVLPVDFTVELEESRGRGHYAAVYALDVLEHVAPHEEDVFLQNICRMLRPYGGTCILGMPSLESQAYASAHSKAGHLNCKTEDGLRALLLRHFHCVYLFGMNDETLHTGYGPMCHYRLALATAKRAPEQETFITLDGDMFFGGGGGGGGGGGRSRSVW